MYALAFEQEPDRRGVLALSLAEGVHKLLKLGRALNLEEDFVVVVRHLDVEVLDSAASRRIGVVTGGASALVVVRHVETGVALVRRRGMQIVMPGLLRGKQR